MRFNSKGRFNVPFCKKTDRFRSAYITKIINQVAWVSNAMENKNWTFLCQDWKKTLAMVEMNDFIYIDPPYVGRHTDYYNTWNENDADELAQYVRNLPVGFAYSMWKENKYRKNEHLYKWFSSFPMVTKNHFYHVGSTESLRNKMEEALILNKYSHINTRDINNKKNLITV